jgi:hypothetical protein
VNGAREEKKDKKVEPIEIRDEVQQEEEANDDEKDAESDGNATDDGYGEFGARGVHKWLRKWTQSELKSCRKLRMQFLQALVDEMDRRFPT